MLKTLKTMSYTVQRTKESWSSQQRLDMLQALKEVASLIPFPGSGSEKEDSNVAPLSLPLIPTYTLVISRLRPDSEEDCPSSIMKASQEALAACIRLQVQLPSKGKMTNVLNFIINDIQEDIRPVRIVAG